MKMREVRKGLLLSSVMALLASLCSTADNKNNALAELAVKNSNQPRGGGTMKKQEGISHALEPKIGISAEDRSLSTKLLNDVLATSYTLLVKTQNYHWNLEGPEFHDYHLLLDDQYKKIQELVDEIAERVRQVGGIALGTFQEFIQHSVIKDEVQDIPAPKRMIENLLVDHEALIRLIRDGINITGEHNRDMGTNNFLCELIAKHEKIAWMLRSLLQRR